MKLTIEREQEKEIKGKVRGHREKVNERRRKIEMQSEKAKERTEE